MCSQREQKMHQISDKYRNGDLSYLADFPRIFDMGHIFESLSTTHAKKSGQKSKMSDRETFEFDRVLTVLSFLLPTHTLLIFFPLSPSKTVALRHRERVRGEERRS